MVQPHPAKSERESAALYWVLFSLVYMAHEVKAKAMSNNVAFQLGSVPIWAKSEKKYRFRLVWLTISLG